MGKQAEQPQLAGATDHEFAVGRRCHPFQAFMRWLLEWLSGAVAGRSDGARAAQDNQGSGAREVVFQGFDGEGVEAAGFGASGSGLCAGGSRPHDLRSPAKWTIVAGLLFLL
jgi:hypothetical protein